MKKYIKILLISIIGILSTLILFQKISLAGNYDGSIKYRNNANDKENSLVHLKEKAVGGTMGFTQSPDNPTKEELGQFDPNDHMYCVKHNEDSDDGKYKIDGYIRIEGNKATGYYKDGTTIKSIKKTDDSNLAMAYILHAEDYAKYYNHNDVRNMAVHHYYSNKWFGHVAKNIGIESNNWSTDYNIDYSTNDQSMKNKAWSLVNNATDYASEKTENAYPEIKATKSEVEYTDTYLGPFVVTYTGKIESIKAYDASDKEVGGIKYYQYNKEVDSASKIDSGKNFYITSKTNIRKVRVKLKENTIYTADIWFVEKSYKTSQQLITVNDGTKKVSAYVDITVKEPKGSLTIIKTDSDGKTKLKAGFKIKNGSGKWLAGTNGAFTYADYAENAGIYYTDSKTGSIKLTNLPYGNYTVCEVVAPSGYELKYQVGYTYNSNWTKNKKTNWERVVANYSKDSAAVPINNSTKDNSINVTNIRKGSITIFKRDAESSKPVTHIKGAGFKIKTSAGTDTWLSGTKETSTTHYNYSASYENATIYYIKDNLYKDDESIKRGYSEDYGEYVRIEGLNRGTYSIYEVEPPTGFLLKHQNGYEEVKINGKTFQRINTKASRTIPDATTNQYNQYIGISNVKKISISGYVWKEGIPDKGSYKDYDSKYNPNIDKFILDGITVKLMKKGSTTPIGTTTTKSDGTYVFDSLIKKSELKDYYIEFDYSSKYPGHVPVAFYSTLKNVTDEQKMTLGSKALVYELPENDNDLSDAQKKYVATTYTGTDSNKIATYGLEKIGTYDENTQTLGNINLGLKPVLDPYYDLRENIAYLKLNIKGYTYTYKYGGTDAEDKFVGISGPTASWQNSNSIYGYSQPIYPSDIIYDRDSSKQELEAIVVYRIDITNNANEDVEELHQQVDTLHLTSLENEYDINRYILDDNNWDDNNKSGKAIIKDINKMSNIEASNTKTMQIKFKVKRDAIKKILENPRGIIEEFPTTVKTNAYHTYYRNDYMWKNLEGTGTLKSNRNLHRTRDRENTAKAPYLSFKIGEQRTISGTVFKDKVITNNGEKLGDGIYNDGEKGIQGVKVELLDIGENLTLSHLYQGKVKEGENGTITAVKDAVVTTDESGKYSLEGVIPGRYYLRFTYGNGNYKITNLNGDEVEGDKLSTKLDGNEINAKDYKSTIINETIKDTLNNIFNYDETGKTEEQLNEEVYTWYKKEEFNNEKYSLAKDDLGVREQINTSEENLNAKALSPLISITIENTKNNSAQENAVSTDVSQAVTDQLGNNKTIKVLNNEKENIKNIFGVFYFGIIEQPKQNADIEKIITNVKLSHVQGYVLYNGNPEKVASQGVVSITDLDGKQNGGSSYVRSEMMEDSLYGANLELTYEVRITNTSDINYYTSEYYIYGDKGDKEKEVTLKPTEVNDYLDKTLKYLEEESKKLNNEKERIVEKDPNNLEKITVDGKNVDAQQFELKDWGKLYTNKITNRDENHPSTDKVAIVAERVLSKNDDDMEIVSYASITGAENSTSGNDSEENVKIIRKADDIKANANATFTITPPTGENRDTLTIYAIAGIISLVILATGIIIIKKKMF